MVGKVNCEKIKAILGGAFYDRKNPTQLTFTLQNKEFEDALSVCVCDEVKELSATDSKVSFDVKEIEKISVKIQYVRNDIQAIKTSVGRFFVLLFFCLLSPIFFFIENDNKKGKHVFFFGAKPFDVTKTCIIKPTEKVISLRYVAPKYDKDTDQYSKPDIEIEGAEKEEELLTAQYNSKALKREFHLYHYPA